MTTLEFVQILKNNNYDDVTIKYILSKNIKIILGRNYNELNYIINLLRTEDIDIRNCLTVLAQGKSKEIENIIKLLKAENIEVRNCLTVLAQGTASEIEKNTKHDEVLQDIEFETNERKVIEYMNYLLEIGVNDYETLIKQKYDLDDDKYNNTMNKIKIKITNTRKS